MAKIVMGALPEPLEVKLVHGDGATLVATLVDEAGAPLNWPAAPTLQFSGAERTVVASHTASTSTSTATWSLSRAQVDAIWTATKNVSEITLVRLTLPDGDDGSVQYSGSVMWSDGWKSGARTQQVTFTLPGGLTGPAGVGVPAGGTTGQVLAKNSGTDYDTEWVDQTGGGGGAVSSVNTRTGAVTLTSADVGLGNVNNTSDASKPVSTAQAAADTAVANAAASALSAHTGNTSNPHAVTKAQVGLGNVDNTADSAKPVSTAQAAADAAVQAAAVQRANHTGTQSADTLTDGTTNKAFTATERTKLAGVATGATANSPDATLLARANHTGTQAQSTVTNLVSDLAGKAAASHTHVATTDLTATGTKDATTFLRGDNTWAVPSGGGGGGLARRGGVYASPNTAHPGGVVFVTLSTVTGDSDLVSGGNIVIPSGADGVWTFSATWVSQDSGGGRKFIDMQINGGGGATTTNIIRASLSTDEDRVTANFTRALSAGDSIAVAVYIQSPTANHRSLVSLSAYRIGA